MAGAKAAVRPAGKGFWRRNRGPVSYTHLDVYKRQMQNLIAVLGMDAPGSDGFGRYMSFEALGQIIGSLSSGEYTV